MISIRRLPMLARHSGQDHRERIGLLPGGGRGRPDAQRTARRPRGEQPRQRLVAEMLERLVVAEEEALVGGHRLDHLARQRIAAWRAQPVGQRGQIAQLLALQDRCEPGLQQIELVGTDHQAGAALQQVAKVSKAAADSAWLMRAPSAASRAASARCAAAAAPRGTAPPARPRPACPRPRWSPRPARSALPPASTTRRVPARPSWPMPVSIATSTRPSQAAAALRSIGSTDGRQKFSGGSVREPCRQAAAGAVHQQVAVAGRQIDPAGLQRSRRPSPRRTAGRPACRCARRGSA